MANILGFDGPAIVLFLVSAVYGIPLIFSFLYEGWYAILIVLALMIVAALGIVLSNPKEYLTVPDFY